ncbi:hypothetical protein [Flavobacterium poyangense]|uniref:hypothetical protein n=1 Tax=Flavobacterium poyangense TaxID=2204302 RepID=UPI001422D7C2|nr:hypothetical protein [Flavobacterium sp. JXAS1]
MKKIILVGLVLFSAISCSESDVEQDKVVSQETSMNIHLNSQKTNITGKDVKRGTLPVTVNNVTIKVQPWDPAGYDGLGAPDYTRLASIFKFGIVSNDNVSAADGFEIRNFSTGISSFQVFANSGTSDEEYVYGSWLGESSTLSVNDLFIKWEQKPVAVNYGANNQIIDVIAGVNTPLSFILNPMNGRVLSVFQLSDELKAWNYSAKVRTLAEGGNSTGPIDVNKSRNAITNLDGYDVIPTAPLKHIIAIFNDKGVKVAEYAVAINAIKGESVNTIYTIHSDKIPAANKLQATILVPDFKSLEPTVKQI